MPPAHGSPDIATSPTMLPFMYPNGLPSGVPPPSLHVFPLTNPSTHFTQGQKLDTSPHRRASSGSMGRAYLAHQDPTDSLAEETSRMSLTASYLYFDDEGYTRWQGETSGLPVLDLLVERHRVRDANGVKAHADPTSGGSSHLEWFPNRQPRRTDVNPQTLWRLITSYIVPDLMDRSVIYIELDRGRLTHAHVA